MNNWKYVCWENIYFLKHYQDIAIKCFQLTGKVVILPELRVQFLTPHTLKYLKSIASLLDIYNNPFIVGLPVDSHTVATLGFAYRRSRYMT